MADCANGGWLNWIFNPKCLFAEPPVQSIPQAVVYENNYPGPSMPPVVSSTMPDGSNIPTVPESGEAAGQTISALVNQQLRDWQSQNRSTIDGVSTDNGPSWMTWLVIGGVAYLGLSLIISPTPRRYGR
jgi:hypothetical protein